MRHGMARGLFFRAHRTRGDRLACTPKPGDRARWWHCIGEGALAPPPMLCAPVLRAITQEMEVEVTKHWDLLQAMFKVGVRRA